MQVAEFAGIASLGSGLALAASAGICGEGRTHAVCDQPEPAETVLISRTGRASDTGTPSLGETEGTASTARVDAVIERNQRPLFARPHDWTTWRVAGDLFASVEHTDGGYRFGRMLVETRLPVGYPAPTPPNAVELKRYPSVRRAEFSGSVDARAGTNLAFFPLFNHIQRNDIAMTSPVEMDFHTIDAEGNVLAGTEGEDMWTMSFLYATADLGPTGADPRDRRVRVVDTEPVTVIAIGLRGYSGIPSVEEALGELNTWLDGQSEWAAAGSPRAFGYNGPSTPRNLRWSEVQIPIVPASGVPETRLTEAGAAVPSVDR